MRLNKRIHLAALFVLQLTMVAVFSAKAQSDSIPLQHIVIRDKWLEANLKKFIQQIKGKSDSFIYVKFSIDPIDHGYIYHIYENVYFREDYYYLVPIWGLWHDKMLTFYSKDDLRFVCSVKDSTNSTNSLRYARRKLLPATVREPGTNTISLVYRPYYGLEYTFKIVKGRLDYFYDNKGNDTREDVPDVLPKVPEPK